MGLPLPAIALASLVLATIGMGSTTESDPGHTYSSGDWESLAATPGAIESSAMAYSPDAKKILLYGGRDPDGLFVNKVWVYDIVTKTWTEKTGWNCSPCPTGRAVHSMVYDDFNDKFVVFGGYTIGGHTFETNETWTYDLATNTWEKMNFGTQQVPPPRHWGMLEYNPDERASYLFGGHFNAGDCPGDIIYNDVWKLDITGSTPTWTQMNPAADPVYGKPAPRQSDWIYNTVENNFYVFGGKSELGPPGGCDNDSDSRESFFNDMWRYDPSTNKWTRIQANQTSYSHFPKERRTDIAYDEQSNRLIMFSGLIDSANQYGKDTWIYDFGDGRWSTMQDADMIVPPVRVRIAATWDDLNDNMYIYGVNDKDKSANFWKLTFFTNNISVNCFNRQPLIFGTDGNDEFSGNNVQNVMYGLLGKDEMKGGKGGDLICGAQGDDILFGEAGNDKLYGYDGNDEILGGPGNDLLRGGAGSDSLSGDAGADKFDCGTGVDTINDFSPAEGDTKTSSCENF